MVRTLCLVGLLLASGCGSGESAGTTTTSSTSASPSPSPVTEIGTYEITAETGPGLPLQPVTITFDTGQGQMRTIRTPIDGYWSHNIEIVDGSSVSMTVQASIFTIVHCDFDALGLLNPIKGKEDVSHEGWTCTVRERTLGF